MTCRDVPSVHRVWIDHVDQFLFAQVGRVGSGGNSGFQALNLAAQWGATDIAMVGLDLRGEHWHGRHPTGLNNPDQERLLIWRDRFAAAAPALAERGVRVVNCSPISSLECWPYMPLEDWCDDADADYRADRSADHAGYRQGASAG